MTQRARFPAVSFAIALLIALALGLSSCSAGAKPAQPELVTFGALPTGSAGLVYIADAQRYFDAQGLHVAVKDYPTGVATTAALLNGEVDIAWSAELPIVRRAFAQEPTSIIAVSSRFVDDQFLLGRKDRGIGKVADVKGKRIGVPRNTIAEFYLGRFLEFNGLDMRAVSLVDVPPPQSVEAVTSGSVDGVVTWDPFSSQVIAQLAEGVAVMPVQSNQPGYGVMSVRNDWLRKHRDSVKAFLRSLAQAEDYLVRNQESGSAIIQQRVKLDDAAMRTFWAQTRFSLAIDQSLITAMELEARWLIANDLAGGSQVPDFLDYVYEDGLKAVKPEAVSVIR